MNFKELALKRESCRNYTDEKVSREKLTTMLECARISPSACNSQPWKFIVVDDDAIASKLSNCLFDENANFNKFTEKVKSFFVLCEQPALMMSGEYNQKYAQMDMGMAAENICLSATDMGLGTCIMGYFHEDRIKDLLKIPTHVKIKLIIAVGYAANPSPRQKIRKDISEISNFNSWE